MNTSRSSRLLTSATRFHQNALSGRHTPTHLQRTLVLGPVVNNQREDGLKLRTMFGAAAAGTALAIGLRSTGPPVRGESSDDISISSNFDSGNIDVLKTGPNNVELNIKFEPYTEGTDKKQHAQWFHFRASNVRGRDCTFRIMNAGSTSYVPGWKGYHACCSYDRKNWFRVPASWIEKHGILSIKFTPAHDTVWFAYFAPFSYEQHQELIAQCAQAPDTTVRSLGKSLDGRDIDMVKTGSGKLKVWITARQHPGESQAEFYAEGFLARLLDNDDALSRKLKSLCTFHVVPNVNPDGSVRGHLRTNACGANLNREWAPSGPDYDAPTLKRSPEVFCILREMEKTGVDFFLDVHGDEALPHVFFAGTQGIKSWDDRLAWLYQTAAEAYQTANPDFGNLAYNYGNDDPGEADMRCADAQVAERFGCLALTLEQPFKDCYDTPQPESGWSPARCRKLGASLLDVLDVVVHDLRRDLKVDPASLKDWVKPGYPCPPSKECSWKK